MGYQPFYISNFDENGGLDNFYSSFLIPEKAFQTLEDALCWRGRIMKRPGLGQLARLRRKIVSITLTNQALMGAVTYHVADLLADAAIDVRAAVGELPETYAEIESLGNTDPDAMTVTVGAISYVDNGDGTLSGTPAVNTGTINYVTGELTLSFGAPLAANTNVVVTFFYFPALPVMGLPRRESSATNNEQNIAFDTKYAYTTVTNKFIELPSTVPTIWNGDDWNLFWTTNYYIKDVGGTRQRLYWATNYNVSGTPDPLRYYDGTTWNTLMPQLNGAAGAEVYLQQAKILIGYKNRLIAMNVWEGHTLATSVNEPNKIRWSKNADPTLVDSWRDDSAGKGGYLYAPTNEAIISASVIHDTLLVKFERSSWRINWTGNENNPFFFQRTNTDLGSESPFSLITFDKGVLAVGDKGITVDDSQSVERIDMKIPNIVFEIKNDANGPDRVYGIRDFTGELAYFSYPTAQTVKFPDKVLVHNYNNGTWAQFNDSFTCYGYFQKDISYIWSTFIDPVNDYWEKLDSPWTSGAYDALFPDIIAGNQCGVVSIVTSAIAPFADNSETIPIFEIDGTITPCRLTVPNHNLKSGTFVKVSGIIGTGSMNPDILNNDPSTAATNRIFLVSVEDVNHVYLFSIKPLADTFDGVSIPDLYPVPVAYDGVYWGGGMLTVLNNFEITTKQFSPFYERGSQCRLGYVNFYFNKTDNGEMTADLYIDSQNSIAVNGASLPANLGNNKVYTKAENIALIPYQATQDRIWHPMYVQAVCQNFTLSLYLSDRQMADGSIDASSNPMTLHALAFFLSPNARLIQ